MQSLQYTCNSEPHYYRYTAVTVNELGLEVPVEYGNIVNSIILHGIN